jgi:hypothetical protein
MEIPLNEEELALVGRFVVAWNQVEQFLDVGVLSLLDVGNDSLEKIMGSPHVPSKGAIFDALVKEKIKDAAILKEADHCVKRINDLSNFRNDVVHGRWATSVDLKLAVSHKKSSAKPVSIQQIGQKYVEVCKLSHRLINVVRQILQSRFPGPFWRSP